MYYIDIRLNTFMNIGTIRARLTWAHDNNLISTNQFPALSLKHNFVHFCAHNLRANYTLYNLCVPM